MWSCRLEPPEVTIEMLPEYSPRVQVLSAWYFQEQLFLLFCANSTKSKLRSPGFREHYFFLSLLDSCDHTMSHNTQKRSKIALMGAKWPFAYNVINNQNTKASKLKILENQSLTPYHSGWVKQDGSITMEVRKKKKYKISRTYAMENEWHLTQKFYGHLPWGADSLIALTRKTLVDVLIIGTPEIFHATSIKSNNSLIFS